MENTLRTEDTVDRSEALAMIRKAGEDVESFLRVVGEFGSYTLSDIVGFIL